jgi:hypothetical protein
VQAVGARLHLGGVRVRKHPQPSRAARLHSFLDTVLWILDIVLWLVVAVALAGLILLVLWEIGWLT